MSSYLILVICILVLFGFILRCQIMFMQIRNGQRKLEAKLSELSVTTKNAKKSESISNKTTNANDYQTNAKKPFYKRIGNLIKRHYEY